MKLIKIKNKKDIYSLLTLGLGGVLLHLSLVLKTEVYAGCLLWIINTWLTLTLHVINHNSFHHAVFLSKSANRFLHIITSLLIGIPASSIAASHIYNHHRHTNDNNDWMRSTLVSNYQGIMRLLRYIVCVLALPRMASRHKAEDVPRHVQQNTNFEFKILFIFYGILFLLFPVKSLVFYFSTRLAGLVILFVLNLIQHDELEHEVGVNRSRNFVGKWINVVLFNNGYHAIHHLRPDAHWSELPRLHNEFVSHMAKKEFTQQSTLVFVFKKYLSPRRFRMEKILN